MNLDLKVILSRLRVVDLKRILEKCDYPKNARKDEIINYLLDLLKSEDEKTNSKKEQLIQNIKIFLPAFKGVSKMEATAEKTNVIMKKIPFFEEINILFEPTALVPKVKDTFQQQVFTIKLTQQQLAEIGVNRIFRGRNEVEHLIQVQLRFGLHDTTTEQVDKFPTNLQIKVNGSTLVLPNPLPTKPGAPLRRFPIPIDITQFIKESPNAYNIINVSWNHEPDKNFVMGSYLVRKHSAEFLMQRLKAKKIQPSEVTQSMIKRKMSREDNEISTIVLRVALACPLGKMRMTNPCRASTCEHIQCFDASLYLQMNERKPTWTCPVCDKPALYDNLVIDGYFLNIINSPKIAFDDNEIQLFENGSWSKLTEKVELKNEKSVKLLELSSDEEDFKPVAAKIQKISQKPRCQDFINNNIVDLTLDDDD